MAQEALREARCVLPNAAILNMYGQTETMISCLPREWARSDAADSGLATSVGFPMPGVRVRIVDDDGRDVADGGVGEIVVQSPAMFRGYLGDPVATSAALRDGWCHTGDVGRIDARGLLYLVDRKKDIIITGGENVYCPEVEAEIRRLPGIRDCAVVGVPDPKWGEAVCAVVVAGPGASPPGLESVRAALRPVLAGYKIPRRLEVLDQLPVLASGKVDKKRLRNALG